MMPLSRKTMLAVEAVVDIAFYGRSEPVQAKEITARQGVPQRYLEQVMQQLVHERVLKGVRGPKGGYMLARERRRIRVGDIVRAIDDIEQADDDQLSKSDLGRAVVGPFGDETRRRLLETLDDVTIEDLCRRADAAGLRRDRSTTADFAI